MANAGAPTLPMSELDELRIAHNTLHVEVRALSAELEVLRPIRSAAEYVTGPSQCVEEDRECDELFDADGNRLPGVDWCSHVKHRNATYSDVHVKGQLEWLVAEILGLVNRTSADLAADIREAIHATVHGLVCDDEADVDVDLEPYKTVLAEEHVDDVLAEIEIAGTAS